MKVKDILKETDNSTVYDRAKRQVDLSCSICKPHKGENAGRKPKHGSKKPKKKDKHGR